MVANRDEKNLDRSEKIPKFAQTSGTVDDFDQLIGISGITSRRTSGYPTVHE